MSAPAEEIPYSAFDVPHVDVKVVDISGDPVGELALTPEEAFELSRSIVGEEDKLATRYPIHVVRAAELSVQEAARYAVAQSFPAEEAKHVDPQEVAATTATVLDTPAMPRSYALIHEKQAANADEASEEDAVAYDPFADDDDQPEWLGDPDAQTEDFAKDVAFHTKQSALAQERLREEDIKLEEPIVLPVTAARIGAEALALEIDGTASESLRAELARLRFKLLETVEEASPVAPLMMPTEAPHALYERLAPQRPFRLRKLVGALPVALLISLTHLRQPRR